MPRSSTLRATCQTPPVASEGLFSRRSAEIAAILRNPQRARPNHLAMMTLNKAKGLALESLAQITGRPPRDLLLVDELTQCRRTGWIFFYESRAYLESGDDASAVGGTGPVVVTHAGEVHHLCGERPVEEALRDFERTRRGAARGGRAMS